MTPRNKKNLDEKVIGNYPTKSKIKLRKDLDDALAELRIEPEPEYLSGMRITVIRGYVDVFIKWRLHFAFALGVIGGIFTLIVFVITHRDEIAFVFNALTIP